MGIGIVLIFWAIAGTIVTGIGCAAMAALATFLTRRVTKHRKKTIIAATLFPVACFVWAGALFFAQAIVNTVLLDRDPGLGDGWYCPLPNGYRVEFIDVTDHGWITNPKTQPDGIIAETDDSISGVRQAQVSGQYILGATDSKAFGSRGDEKHVDGYFIIDTKRRAKDKFASMDELKAAAGKLGITVNLEPIYNVYGRYRWSWFDGFIGILFVGVPFVAFVLLMLWVWKLPREGVAVGQG